MSTAAPAVEPPAPDRFAEAKIVKQADGKTYNYIHGEVSFPINFEKLSEAMAQMDQCGPENYKKLALLMGLPVEPFTQKHLRPVLVGGVQIVWHRAHGATEEDLELLKKKQEGRVSRYLQDLEELKKKPPVAASSKIKDAFKSGGGGRAPGGGGGGKGQAYRLNPALQPTWAKFDKQKGLVIKAFQIAGGAATTAQLVEIIKAYPPESAMTTNQPVERVVGFYLSEWKRNGLVEVTEGGSTNAAPPPEPVAPKTEEVPPEEKKEEVPATDVTKLDTSKKGKKKK